MENAEKSLIAKFSTFFVRNYRTTILLFVGILVLGYGAYTSFLTREGFPTVQVPIVIIQTPYFVDSAEKVNEEVTTEIEEAISDITEINKVQSTTGNNFSLIIVEFDQDFSSKEGSRLIKEQVDKDANLPEGVETKFQTVNAASIDREHDLLFTISDDRSIDQLQEKAQFIAVELEKLKVVAEANSIDLITKEVNPLTGEEFDYQSSFNRVGIKNNDIVEFSSAVSIGVKKKGNVGAIELSDAVRNELDKLANEGELEDLQINYGGDLAGDVKMRISDLEDNASTGLIAVVIILFFLIGWRASIVAAIFIPTVIAATAVGLFFIGYTLNIITLFSLILVLGLFVDDAIVVIEAIDYQKRQGKKGIKAIASAISDIGPADITGTLTTVLVFLPMAFISGLLGDFLKIIPITVILSLILSIIIGLTITPMLSNIIIADKKVRKIKAKFLMSALDLIFNGTSKLVNKLGYYSGRFVYHYLQWKVLSLLMVVLSILLIVGGGSFASKLTFAVFPPAKDSDQISIFLTYPNGTNIETAEEIAKDAEVILLLEAEEYVKEVNYFRANENETFINVVLIPMDEREITSKLIVENLKPQFEDFGDTRVRVEQSGVGPPIDEFQINIQVFSDDVTILNSAITDIEIFLTNKEISDGEKVIDVLVSDLSGISKIDKKRVASVKAKISDPNNSELILNLQQQIEEQYDKDRLTGLGLEEDALGFDLGQEGENIESFQSAGIALIFALLLMYGLLVFQFNSFTQPLLIFLAIPFAFPVLFPGLYLTNNPLSFFVMLGIIALSGIVVNNSIFLVDYANRYREEGHSINRAIEKAVQVRFRPIIATSATTIVALLPITLADPFWESLGLTIIFGLAASSVMVILVLPVYYGILEKLRDSRSKWIRKIT